MLRLLPILLLTVAAATACGSSGKSSATTSTAAGGTDTQSYVAAGNQVCIRSDRRIFKIGRLSRDAKGWQETATVAKSAVIEMRKVKPPPARAAAFSEMLHYGNALALAVQQVHDALVKSNLDTASAAQFAAAQIQDKVHTAAKAAGLTFCQQPLTNWPA
ncbi:MAG: hypothetical protein QOD85_2594 [Gaiellaceae bacterium]|nr:hypothetical protein [Gaiellaceae bacterium]